MSAAAETCRWHLAVVPERLGVEPRVHLRRRSVRQGPKQWDDNNNYTHADVDACARSNCRCCGSASAPQHDCPAAYRCSACLTPRARFVSQALGAIYLVCRVCGSRKQCHGSSRAEYQSTASRQSRDVRPRCVSSAAREGIMFSGRFDGGPKEKFLRAVAVRTCGYHSCYGCALLPT